MNFERCRRLCRELSARFDARTSAALEEALGGLPQPEGEDGDGFVMSLVEGTRAVRFFRDPRRELEASSPGASGPWPGVRSFARLARRLNKAGGLRFDADALEAVASLGEAGAAVGWPFYGIKARRGSGLALTLYLIERSLVERSGWEGLAGVLALVGLDPASAAAACFGRYDCLGLDLTGSGGVELKVYTRFAPPRGRRGQAELLKRHGAQGAPHFRWWADLGRRSPVRHWTQAVRFRRGQRGAFGVKTEAHFLGTLEPRLVARTAAGLASGRWIARSAAWVEQRGAKFSSLAAEGGRACLYFR